jgi:hypothetical protein
VGVAVGDRSNVHDAEHGWCERYVAVDEREKLGFTNVDLGTVDAHSTVILPQGLTVKT